LPVVPVGQFCSKIVTPRRGVADPSNRRNAVAGTNLQRNLSMRRSFQAVVYRTISRAAVFSLLTVSLATIPGDARAIEMFTYFGDGSRIGLPSLEVPIEAYPGIPLRSDRIRARNRAMMMRRGMPAQPGIPPTQQPASGVTIRSMPVLEQERIPTPAR
jgi:hypothetical protein